MIKLRKILLSNYLYLILIILGIFFEIYQLEKDTKSKYLSTTREVTVYLTDYKIDGNQLSLECKGKEKLIGIYYFKTKQEKNTLIKNIQLGDKLKITGKLKRPSQNTTEHLFNYRKYLERKNIFYIIQIDNMYLLEENHHLFYWIKDKIYQKTENPYLRTFILGDTSLLPKNIIKNYQDIGISHLFAISGMHISLLSSLLLKILKKVRLKENTRYIIVSLFLICYLCLVGFSPSVLRAVLFFILFSINKIYYFYIKPVHIFIVVLLISLIIQPNSIFDVAFLYSFSISFALIVLSNFINCYKNYFFKLLLTSIISFIVSLPITLYHFNQINVLSIVYNLFYVPLVSIIIFPLSLITFFISPLEKLLNIGINLLEYSSSLFTKIHFSKFIFCNIPYFFYFVYCFFIVLFFVGLYRKKYFCLFFLLMLFICHYMYPYINQEDYLTMLDVGQGDSILLHSQNKTVLVDTGGMMSYNNEKWSKRKNNYSIVENTTIPYLKKQGIKKIDDLILTQGHLVLCTRNYLKKTNQLSLILSKSCSIWSIYSYQNNLLCFLSNLL